MTKAFRGILKRLVSARRLESASNTYLSPHTYRLHSSKAHNLAITDAGMLEKFMKMPSATILTRKGGPWRPQLHSTQSGTLVLHAPSVCCATAAAVGRFQPERSTYEYQAKSSCVRGKVQGPLRLVTMPP